MTKWAYLYEIRKRGVANSSRCKQIGKVCVIEAKTVSTISDLIDITRFSKYLSLLGTTVGVTAVFTQTTKSLKNIYNDPFTQDYEYAKMLWIKDAKSKFNCEEM